MSEELERKVDEFTPEEELENQDEVKENLDGQEQEVNDDAPDEASELMQEEPQEHNFEEEPQESLEEKNEEPIEPEGFGAEEQAPAEEPKEEEATENEAPLEEENVTEPVTPEEKPKKEKKTKEDNKPNKKHRLSRSARIRRIIILVATIYLDAVIILLCFKYVGAFINGLLKLISGDMNGSIGNRDFATSLFILAVLIIINVISLSLYHDARKIKGKSQDDLLAMLEDTESVDGHRIVESEYNVDEETKQVVYRNAKTIESIDIVKVQNDFIQACTENGIEMDKSNARLVLSSVFASRLIVVKNDDKGLRQKFINILSSFFGNESYLTELEENTTRFEEVIWKLTAEGNVPTSFSRGLNASRQYPDKVNMVSLDGVKAENMQRLFKDILGYVKNPSINCQLRIGNRNVDNGYRQLPKNVWFIFGMNNEEILPSEVAKYSMSLELDLKATEEASEKTTFKPVDYPQVLDFLNEAYEDHFIEEDNWKKLDTFNEYLNDRGDFFIDNRIVREMERFTAVYLSLDGDQTDLIDTLLTVKLLLIALPNEYKNKINDDEGLVAKAEAILGADAISKSSQLLKKIKID